MSEEQLNYASKKLSEIAEIINGYAFKSKNYTANGIRIIRIANVQEGYIVDDSPCYYPEDTKEDIEKYKLFEGDLLVSLTGNVGRVGVLPATMLPAALNQRVCCLRVKENIVDKKFLFYYLQQYQFVKACIKASKGVAQLNLSTKWVADYRVPISSIDKQKQIVAKIEEMLSHLDDAVETLNKTKEQLKVYRQAVYSSVYGKNTNMHKITDFFEITGGLTKNSKRNLLSIKMPYLRVANVYYNRLDLNEIKKIGVKESEIIDKTLIKEDLLFVEGNGSKSEIGRVAIWDGSIEGCLHQNHVIKGRPNGKMDSRYALYYLISEFGRKQIIEVASSTSGLYTLSINKVKNLTIPFCDKEEQIKKVEEIEEKISVCNNIEKTVDMALQQAEALRQSILKKAFKGNL